MYYICALHLQLIFEANLHVNLKSIVGLDDILIANGSCCPIINTPNDTAKGNMCMHGVISS